MPGTPKRKFKKMHRTENQVLKKEVCPKDVLKGKEKAYLGKRCMYRTDTRWIKTDARIARMVRKFGNFYAPADPRWAFVISISMNGVNPKF